MTRHDVLVLGGGVAGLVTATALARRGLRVLVVGAPADPTPYDVLVGAPARQGLASLGVEIPGRVLDVLDLGFGDRSRRPVSDLGALVCDRNALDRALRRAAVEAGAELLTGSGAVLASDAEGHLVRVVGPGPGTVVGRHLVLATGPGRGGPGVGATCAVRIADVDLGRRAVLALAAPAAPGAPGGPTAAWALPGADGTVTVGAAYVGADPPPLATLLNLGLDTLAVVEPRLAGRTGIHPTGGPLDPGFSPDRLRGAAGLLVGEAAGLSNPFTGEGLSYAVQSGLIAAGCVAAQPAEPGAARDAYAHRLTATFVGYFETARHAARRYLLTWRVLADAADSDQPFFAKARRAILLPDGFAAPNPLERISVAGPDAATVGAFLVACDEVAVHTVRREWPFLARLAGSGETFGQHQLRPAVPFLAGLLAARHAPDIRRATPAAAIELATLGALAFLWPPPARSGRRGVDWALAATVLSGDFLLAQASRLIAESAPEVSGSFAAWLADLTELRAARLGPRPTASARDLAAALFEFPARAGADLGGADEDTVRAVQRVAAHCGHGFLHGEDVLALRGRRTRLDTSLPAMFAGRFTAIPESLPGERIDTDRLAAEPALRAAVTDAATTACRDAGRLALDAVAAVPDAPARRILTRLVRAIMTPVLGPDGSPPQVLRLDAR